MGKEACLATWALPTCLIFKPREPIMKRQRITTYYVTSVLFAAVLFASGFSACYGLIISEGVSSELYVELAYLVLILGLFLLTIQAVFVFKSMLSPLDAYRDMVEKLKIRLEKIEVKDELTMAFNRKEFERVMVREVENIRRYSTNLCGIMLDLDDYKDINEKYGYSTGDKVLASLALLISKYIRKTDYLFRWRGGKFIVLAPHIQIEQAELFAEKLRKAVEAKAFPGSLRMTISLGVTQISQADTPDLFVLRARGALAEAKQAGRNRLKVLDAA